MPSAPSTQIEGDRAIVVVDGDLAGITGLRVIDLHGGSLSSPRLAPGAQIAQGDTLLDI
jgi:hypothetical protein